MSGIKTKRLGAIGMCTINTFGGAHNGGMRKGGVCKDCKHIICFNRQEGLLCDKSLGNYWVSAYDIRFDFGKTKAT